MMFLTFLQKLGKSNEQWKLSNIQSNSLFVQYYPPLLLGTLNASRHLPINSKYKGITETYMY